MNVMSSPGAGKTTFLVETIKRLKNRYAIGVVEGDVASQIDAERIRQTGVPVVQVNTGGACHLDAGMVARSLPHLPLDELDVVIIENVGNLVCPAEWNLGEHLKVTLLSIPEGDDKPLKYPLMFAEGDVLVLNKIDLLPYFSFDLEQVERTVRGFNPNVTIFKVSATRGDGLDEWLAFLGETIDQARGEK
jgi:hydrogenase nickel incorporation protein HypB